ncbi:MAG: hypothetical protein ABI432_06225 [Flavobacteriales bacterium]
MSLLPDAIDVKLSRGHPLLFQCATASWMHLFGPTRESMHTFALSISVGLLVATYWVGSRVASQQVGVAATLLLALNEAFLAQSGILLPEVLLALLGLLAAGFYITRSPWMYVIAALAALMTKESALVLVLALLVWHTVSLFMAPIASRRVKDRWWFVILASPLLLASSFFVFQKLEFGWYFFPEHLGLITWDLKDIIYKIKLAYGDVFESQGMLWLTYAFGLIAPFVWRGLRVNWSLLVVVLNVTAIKILFGRWTLPPIPTLVITGLCLAVVFWLISQPLYRTARERGSLVGIGYIFTLGFLAFSALNFFSDRYLLCLIPFVGLGTLVFLSSALEGQHKWLFPALVLVVACAMCLDLGRDDKVGDTRLSYADDIRVHQEVIHYLESRDLQRASIQTSFMLSEYLTHFETGYLSVDRPFSQIGVERDENTRYIVCSTSTPGSEYEEVKRSDFVLRESFASGKAWVEFYERPK